MSKPRKKQKRNAVTIDVDEFDGAIDEIMRAGGSLDLKRGPVIKAALRVGLPLLLAKVKGAK